MFLPNGLDQVALVLIVISATWKPADSNDRSQTVLTKCWNFRDWFSQSNRVHKQKTPLRIVGLWFSNLGQLISAFLVTKEFELGFSVQIFFLGFPQNVFRLLDFSGVFVREREDVERGSESLSNSPVNGSFSLIYLLVWYKVKEISQVLTTRATSCSSTARSFQP